MNIYRENFVQVVWYYYGKGVINDQERADLLHYVENDGYIDWDSEEFKEMLEFVKLPGPK